jgi:hypothetical protein
MTKSPSPSTAPTASATDLPKPTPKAKPWAFGPTYDEDLPDEFDYQHRNGYFAITEWVKKLEQAEGSSVMPVDVVLAYKNSKIKGEEVEAATGIQRDAAEAAYTVSGAVKRWPARKPCVGLVSSPLSDAVDHQQGHNRWHMVAMARDGNDVWIHDPSYNAGEHKDKERRRIAGVSGTKMVQELVCGFKVHQTVLKRDDKNALVGARCGWSTR